MAARTTPPPQAADTAGTEGAEAHASAAAVVPQQVSLIEAALSARDTDVEAAAPVSTPAPNPEPESGGGRTALRAAAGRPAGHRRRCRAAVGQLGRRQDCCRAGPPSRPSPRSLRWAASQHPWWCWMKARLILVETRKDLSQVKLPFEA